MTLAKVRQVMIKFNWNRLTTLPCVFLTRLANACSLVNLLTACSCWGERPGMSMLGASTTMLSWPRRKCWNSESYVISLEKTRREINQIFQKEKQSFLWLLHTKRSPIEHALNLTQWSQSRMRFWCSSPKRHQTMLWLHKARQNSLL